MGRAFLNILMKKNYDAIIVLSGGLTSKGELQEWAKRRADLALEIYTSETIIIASGRTTHKHIPVKNGEPVFEAEVMAKYLMRRGIEKVRILQEAFSCDTIGNAYFTRCIHTDPAGFRKLLVITSDFHMPRSKKIFEWVFRLNPVRSAYELDFMAASDEGIDRRILAPRMKKEKARLATVAALKKRIKTMRALHAWIYGEHAAYATGLIPEKDPKKIARSY